MEEELQNYGACDPTKIQEKKRGVVLAKEAAVRWTGDRFHHVPEMSLTRPQTIILASRVMS